MTNLISLKRICLLACFVLVGLSLPAHGWAAAWPGNAIGDGFGVQVKPERTDESELAKIKSYGFNYIRYDMRWHEVEHQRGRYDWGAFDTFIERMRKAGLKAVVILNGGNEVYSGMVAMDPDKNFGFNKAPVAPTSDEDIQAFAAFAAAAVKRYGIDDIVWEIWNEPDMGSFWPPAPNATAFAKLASLTCTAMRGSNPQAVIVAPGVAHLPAANTPPYSAFMQTVLAAPVAGCITAISLHPYRMDKTPETVIGDYAQKVKPFITTSIPSHKMPPMIASEWGYPTNKVSEEQQAAYLIRDHLSDLISGVPLTIWYEWKDSRPGPAPNDMEAHFGIVDHDGGNKQGAVAAMTLLPKIADAMIESRVTSPNVNCYVLRLKHADGRHELLGWVTNEQMSNSTLSVGQGTSAQRHSLTPFPQLFDDGQNAKLSCG